MQDQQVRQRRTRPPAAVSMRARRNEGDVEGEGWGSAVATKAKNRRGPRNTKDTNSLYLFADTAFGCRRGHTNTEGKKGREAR